MNIWNTTTNTLNILKNPNISKEMSKEHRKKNKVFFTSHLGRPGIHGCFGHSNDAAHGDRQLGIAAAVRRFIAVLGEASNLC